MLMKEEKKFTKEEAVELLGNDNITANIYDLLKAVDAKSSPEQLSIVYAADDADLTKKEEWESALKEITTWLDSYKALNRGERLSISDLVVTGAKSYVHGVLLIVCFVLIVGFLPEICEGIPVRDVPREDGGEDRTEKETVYEIGEK